MHAYNLSATILRPMLLFFVKLEFDKGNSSRINQTHFHGINNGRGQQIISIRAAGNPIAIVSRHGAYKRWTNLNTL
jgi:hypothetical protein